MGRDEGRDKKRRHRSHRHHRRDDDGNNEDDDDSADRDDSHDEKDRSRRHKNKKNHHKRKEESSSSKRRKRKDEDPSSGDDSDGDVEESSRDEERRRHRRKHRRDHSSRAEEERRSKKDRKADERKKSKKRRKKRRGDDDDSLDSEKRRKKSKHSSKVVVPQKPDKATLYPMGDSIGKAPNTLINPETDYFTYHQEFWVYLYREEGIRFNDLTSEEAREAFLRFAKQYNTGKLEAPYYDNPPTFPSQVLDESKTTQHKWAFQTTETERRGLEQLQEGVRRLTQYTDEGKAEISAAGKKSTEKEGASRGPAPNDEEYPMPRKTPEERVEERRVNRRLREHVRTTHEEITGGAKDLRERQIEKRKEQATRIHGAARDKEEGAGVELSDAAVYGDGDRSFQEAVARQRQSKARREEERNARVEELQNRERERQENMLKMLGLDGVKPGHKITIAPRKDG